MLNRACSFLAALLLSWPITVRAQEPLVFTGIENSSYASISERVMLEAYGRMGREVAFSSLPAARALVVSNSGRVDGELYRIKNIHLKYPNLIMLPVPIGIMEGVAITTDPDISLSGWDSLQSHRVCIRNGVKFAEAGTKNIDVHIANSNEQLFRMLGKNRCDIIILARLTSIALAQAFTKTEKKPVYYSLLQTYPLFHYLHKKNENLVPELTKILEEMESDGTISKIREDYIAEISSIN